MTATTPRGGRRILLTLLLLPLPAIAAPPAGFSGGPAGAPAADQAQRDWLVRFGTVATLAPLCGLRDQGWGADLQRSEFGALGLPPPGTPAGPVARQQADRAGATLSYAEDEALEDFAEAAPHVTCDKLAADPDLHAADDLVRAFRAGTARRIW